MDKTRVEILDRDTVKANPDKYPTLAQEIAGHDRFTSSPFYTLSEQGYREWLQFETDKLDKKI